MSLTIIEAFNIAKDGLIIFISGMSGTGISQLGSSLGKLLNLNIFDTKKYCNIDYNITKKINEEVEVINWDSDDIYDWNKINDYIKENKKNGLIVVGTALPSDKINIKADLFIYIKLSKDNILERRVKFAEVNKAETCNKNILIENAKLIYNNLTFPYYDELIKRSNITKFINANNYAQLDKEEYNEKILNDSFEYIINNIQENINKLSSDEHKKIKKHLQQNIKSDKTEVITENKTEEISDENSLTSTEDDDVTLSSTDMDMLDEGTYIMRDNKTYDVIEN
jgi:shikimate kinase